MIQARQRTEGFFFFFNVSCSLDGRSIPRIIDYMIGLCGSSFCFKNLYSFFHVCSCALTLGYLDYSHFFFFKRMGSFFFFHLEAPLKFICIKKEQQHYQ